MDIQTEHVGDACVVTASGRIDGIYSTAFANQVGALITGENPKILLDFADVDMVTSAGLRALLLLVKKASATGCVFALCGVNAEVLEVFNISGFTGFLTIHPDRPAGLAALSK
jgi:anti-anti-sigma factor